jgi:hypothetical protein
MFGMSTGQGTTIERSWIATTTAYSKEASDVNFDELHCEVSKN